MWMTILWSLVVAPAAAQEVTSDACGQMWADYFNAGLEGDAQPTGNVLFQAADAIGRIGQRKQREVIVASCEAGEADTSTIYDWHGEFVYSAAGTPIVQGTCTQVDVVEVQGRRRDRCRRFPTSRICRHVDDPSRIAVVVGQSSTVPCEGQPPEAP